MEEDEQGLRRGRLLGFRIAVVVAFLVLARQLFVLQVLETDTYRRQADDNRERIVWALPERGVIYDRNGVQLVRNVPTFTVAIVRADLPATPEVVYQRLGRLLGLAPEAIRATVEEKGRQYDAWTPIPIVRNADFAHRAFIEERPGLFPGVKVVDESVRDYLDGPAFAHVLGYLGPMSEEEYEERRLERDRRYMPSDRIGQAGIEARFDRELRGFPAQVIEEVDSTGRVRDRRLLRPPVPGYNVVLTLDARLQRRVADILAQHIDRYGTASAIVMEVKTGNILAMVDLPSYDNNMFSRAIDDDELAALLNDPRRPLLNKAVGGAYPPGSVFKLVTALAALQEGIIFPTTVINCPGSIFIPSDVLRGQGERLNDWTPDGHGDQDVVSALANSCDIFFYEVAGGEPLGKWPGLGNELIAYYARLFGLGAETRLGLAGEIPGLVPDARWKARAIPGEPWLKGNTYTYGIGQSYLQTTPIQLLNMLVAILNNGTLLQPRLVVQVRDGEGRVIGPLDALGRLTDPARPQVLQQIPIDPRWFELVKRGMVAGMEPLGQTENGTRYVGTSYDSAVPEVRFAGKTGTAETGRGKQTHGWFVGYAPWDDPEIAVVVFVENGSGSYNAAVRAEKIVRAYYGLPDTDHDDTFK